MQGKQRTRGRGRKSSNQVNKTLDSNGPDVKIRGTASHIYEKYQTLARDANSSGDKVSAENYLQHAEHYFRLMAAMQAANQQNQNAQPNQQQNHSQPSYGHGDLNGHALEADPFGGEQPVLNGNAASEDDLPDLTVNPPRERRPRPKRNGANGHNRASDESGKSETRTSGRRNQRSEEADGSALPKSLTEPKISNEKQASLGEQFAEDEDLRP